MNVNRLSKPHWWQERDQRRLQSACWLRRSCSSVQHRRLVEPGRPVGPAGDELPEGTSGNAAPVADQSLTFPSAGNASPSHLCGEMLKRQADIDMTHVPYSGAAPAMNAVLAGDVTMYCAPIRVGMAHFKAGKVYALGVTGTARSPLLPELAPLSAIYPGFVISPWLALFAPVATPPAVTQLVRDELKKAYADPELQQKLAILALAGC